MGVRVFGREAGYDTNDDAIVRVWANELRKRLACYYQEAGVDAKLRLSIPPGSYRVAIEELAPATPAATALEGSPGKPARRRWIWGGAVLLPVLAAAGFLLFHRSPTAVDRFWGPALESRKAVVVCLPHPVVYNFTPQFYDRMWRHPTTHFERQTQPLVMEPGASISPQDVIAVPDTYITVATSNVIANLAALFGVRGKPYRLRLANDVSFEDLRRNPAILVGALSNRWTLELTAQLPFSWVNDPGNPYLLDRRSGKTWSVPRVAETAGKVPEDFALITRLFHPQTGELVVSLAGIAQHGTRAAGELVTDEALLRDALRSAPAGWEKRNLQLMLHVKVVRNTPAPAEVLATHVW